MKKPEPPNALPRMLFLEQAITLMESLGMTAPSIPSLITWIEKYNLGHKVAGRWVVREAPFHSFLLGEYENEKEWPNA